MRDLEKELRGWDGDWPPCWRPKPGDILVGRVLRYDQATTTYGDVRTVIVEKEDGTGKVSIFLSQEVLRREFERQKPKAGERIGVKFGGRHESKGYNLWALICDREETEPDFSPLGGEHGDADDQHDGDPFASIPSPYAQETVQRSPAPPRPAPGRR